MFPEGSWAHLLTTTAEPRPRDPARPVQIPRDGGKAGGSLERIGCEERRRKQRSGSFWARDACALSARRRRDQAEAKAHGGSGGAGAHGGAGACDRGGRRPQKARVTGADGLTSCVGTAHPPSLGSNHDGADAGRRRHPQRAEGDKCRGCACGLCCAAGRRQPSCGRRTRGAGLPPVVN